MEIFFDKAFEVKISDRFQTMEEMIERFELIMNPSDLLEPEEPSAVARRIGEEIEKKDRRTQLVRYKEVAERIVEDIDSVYKVIKDEVAPFYFITNAFQEKKFGHVENTDDLRVYHVIQVVHRPTRDSSCIVYEIRAKEKQCCVYRRIFKNIPPGIDNWKPVEGWFPVLWYNAIIVPDLEKIRRDVKESINRAMRIVLDSIPGE